MAESDPTVSDGEVKAAMEMLAIIYDGDVAPTAFHMRKCLEAAAKARGSRYEQLMGQLEPLGVSAGDPMPFIFRCSSSE